MKKGSTNKLKVQNKIPYANYSLRVRSEQDKKFLSESVKFFDESNDNNLIKMKSFTKYSSREMLTLFLSRYEIFKKVANIPGSIVDCGVNSGQSLFTFAKLLSIYEPFNYNAKVFGFDTFKGFQKISQDDKGQTEYEKEKKIGASKYSDYENILQAIKLFDLNRPVNHIKKIEIFKGDVKKTVPKFVKNRPEVVVRLLNLDMDLYEPTKTALKYFLPHIPKGGIIIFDEFNSDYYPGETKAVKELMTLNHLKLRKIPFDATMSFAIMQ